MSNVDLSGFNLEQGTLDAVKAASRPVTLIPQPNAQGVAAPDPWPLNVPVSHIWQEDLQIVDVEAKADEKTAGRVIIMVKFMSPADSGSPNAGRRHTEFIRLDPMGADGKYNTMTEISFRKIDGFVSACGVEYVEENGQKNPARTIMENCTGCSFRAAIRKRNRPDKRSPGVWYNEDVEVLGQAR